MNQNHIGSTHLILSHAEHQKIFKQLNASGEEFYFTSHSKPDYLPVLLFETKSKWNVTPDVFFCYFLHPAFYSKTDSNILKSNF